MHARRGSYVRFTCTAVLAALLSTLAFFAGYRLGYFDGYAQFEMTFNGKRVQMMPLDEDRQLGR